MEKIDLGAKLADEAWSRRIVAELNDAHVKLDLTREAPGDGPAWRRTCAAAPAALGARTLY